MTRILLLAAAAAVLASAAQAQPRMSEAMVANTAAMAPDFVETAAASDLFERESGELAAAKGMSPEVKTFGRQMIADHTRMSEMLAQAARQSGQPAPASRLSPGQQRQLADLKTMEGADFDKAYLQQQHAAHKDALGLMTTYARQGEAPALKSLAAEGVPIVQGHLDMIKRMQNGAMAMTKR